MNENKDPFHIVLTGGGTAGHVMPHLALLPLMREKKWTITYIGSKAIESKLCEKYKIDFHEILCGKIRRYISLENFFDLFRVFLGTIQSFFILLKLKPDLVFSKGGYVSVPVVMAAKILKIPIITHESDYTPGLANKIIAKVADKIFYAFVETINYLPKQKSKLVGIPIRDELLEGDKELGRLHCHFYSSEDKKTLLVMGGSLGAQKINDFIFSNLDGLLKNYNLIHLTGPKKSNSEIPEKSGYWQQEFAHEELSHLLALSDIVICRAGANSIFELAALKKPMILIPLEKGSRGDQLLNANSFKKQGMASVILESNLSLKALENLIQEWSTNVFPDSHIPSKESILEELIL